MNSDKIAPIIMAVLFLSSILASSGCLEDTDNEVPYYDDNNDDNNYDDSQNNNGNNNNF